MLCRECYELLYEYLDRELTPAVAQEIRQHIAGCPLCVEDFDFENLFLGFFFFSSRRRHTRYIGEWSSDVCSSDLYSIADIAAWPWVSRYQRSTFGYCLRSTVCHS